MEKMTESERKLLRDLQAKAKRVARAEEDFYKEADRRKDELLRRWAVVDRLEKAADVIGTTADDLYDWITSPTQRAYYRRAHHICDVTESNFVE